MIPQTRPVVSPFAVINFTEIDRLQNLPSSTIRVYLALGAHANAEGTCWPGRKRLGELCTLSREQVSKATGLLSMAGLVEKTYLDNGRILYRLPLHQHGSVPLPVTTPPGVNPDTPPGVNPDTRRTDQRTNQGTERATPARAPVEPQAQVPLSEPVLRTPEPPRPVKVPPPDEVPMDWITVGAEMRPDLDAAIIQASAEKFLDDRRSKAIVLVDWTPSWKNWIRNERAPKAPTKPTVTSPYSNWEPGKVAPISQSVDDPEANQRAYERHCLHLGVDPVTGKKLGPAIVKPEPIKIEVTPVVPPVEEVQADIPKAVKRSPLAGVLDQLRSATAPVPRPENNIPWQRKKTSSVTPEEVEAAELEIKRRREAAAGRQGGLI